MMAAIRSHFWNDDSVLNGKNRVDVNIMLRILL